MRDGSASATLHRTPGASRSWTPAFERSAIFILAAVTVASAGPAPSSLAPAPQAAEEDWDWGTLPMDDGSSKTSQLILTNKCKEDRTITVEYSYFMGDATAPGWVVTISGEASQQLAKDYEPVELSGRDAGWKARFVVPGLASLPVELSLLAPPDGKAHRDSVKSWAEDWAEVFREPGDDDEPYEPGTLDVEHQGSFPGCLPRVTKYRIKGRVR